jgi:hypothetical protein
MLLQHTRGCVFLASLTPALSAAISGAGLDRVIAQSSHESLCDWLSTDANALDLQGLMVPHGLRVTALYGRLRIGGWQW